MDANIKTAIFPALLEPAKKAAQSIIDGTCTKCTVEGQEGFWVSLESDAQGFHISHSFEYEGKQFVIYEQVME